MEETKDESSAVENVNFGEKIREYINSQIDFSKEYIDKNTEFFLSYIALRYGRFKKPDDTVVFKLYSSYDSNFSVEYAEPNNLLLSMLMFKKVRDLFVVASKENAMAPFDRMFMEKVPNDFVFDFTIRRARKTIKDLLYASLLPLLMFDDAEKKEVYCVRLIDIFRNNYKLRGYLHCESGDMALNFFRDNVHGELIQNDYEETKSFFTNYCTEFIKTVALRREANKDKVVAVDDVSSDENFNTIINFYANKTLFNKIIRSYPVIERFFNNVIEESIPEYEPYKEFCTAMTCLGFEFNTFTRAETMFHDKMFSSNDHINLDKFYLERFKASPSLSEKDVKVIFMKTVIHYKGTDFMSKVFFGQDSKEIFNLAKEYNAPLLKEVDNLIDVDFMKAEVERILNIQLSKEANPTSGETAYHQKFMRFFVNIVDRLFKNPEYNIFSLKDEDMPSILLNSACSTPKGVYLKKFIQAASIQAVNPAALNDFENTLCVAEVLQTLSELAYHLKYFYNIEIGKIDCKFASLSQRNLFNHILNESEFYEKIQSSYKRIDDTLNFFYKVNQFPEEIVELTKIESLPIYSAIGSKVFFLRLKDLPDIIKNTSNAPYKFSDSYDEAIYPPNHTSFTREGLSFVDNIIEFCHGYSHDDPFSVDAVKSVISHIGPSTFRMLNFYTYVNYMTLSGLIVSNHDSLHIYSRLDEQLELARQGAPYVKDFLNTVDADGKEGNRVSDNTVHISSDDTSYFESIFHSLPNANGSLYKDEIYYLAKAYNDSLELKGYCPEGMGGNDSLYSLIIDKYEDMKKAIDKSEALKSEAIKPDISKLN